MKKKNLYLIFIALTIILSFSLSGCQAVSGVLNKVPEKYTEGIKYDRDFPDDVIEIYDDAIVYESRELFGSIVLAFGSQDDIDDVIDFYRDFFKDNEIVLSEEEEGRDNYYARGYYEGYEFKIQIEEADGEYVEDLFECIAYLSAKESDAQKTSIKAEPTPAPSMEVQETTEETPSPTPASNDATPTPKPSESSSGETPLYVLPEGSWELYWIGSQTTTGNADATMQINSDGTGTFYYYDYDYDDRDFYTFTYEVGNGELTLSALDGEVPYYAYYDDGILHLIHQTDGTEMYLANWNEVYSIYPSDSVFTAYGDWMYYEPSTGYMETISFWPNGSGYIYNWNGSYENVLMYWEYENGMFTIYDDYGDEYTYGIVHNGEVFELHQLNGSVFFYNRVTRLDMYAGAYYMTETNEDDLSEWSISLYANGNLEYTINGSDSSGTWYIEKSTGQIILTMGDADYTYNYHYDVEGLHFWDSSDTYYYYFISVG